MYVGGVFGGLGRTPLLKDGEKTTLPPSVPSPESGAAESYIPSLGGEQVWGGGTLMSPPLKE